VVKPELWKRLIKKYPPKNEKKIGVGSIEIFRDWLPWFADVNLLIDDADVFEGVRFVKLKYVLAWKKILGREKDKRDIELIKEYCSKCSEVI
jgi:hypothetical protein